MIRIGSIVWGVRDIPRAVAFWAEALGYRPLREPDVDWALLEPGTSATSTQDGER